MKNSTFLAELQQRGLVKDHTDWESLELRLEKQPITFYCGFDPTADSLHLGHLQMIVLMRRFQLRNHHVLALAGGSTGLIGDPSGKSQERILQSAESVRERALLIQNQLKTLLPIGDNIGKITFVNNLDWTENISAIQFLRDIGKHFSMNYMLSKDSVQKRLGNTESGLSYTEFSYMLLQALDYLNLFEKYHCELQLGGSDQWGNIVSGITLIGKKHHHICHGLTSPLVMRSDGQKFGKSDGGAIWLDAKQTSAYELYQYLVNLPDKDALPLLYRLTLLPLDQIYQHHKIAEHQPESRSLQKCLAYEVVQFVHGDLVTQQVLKITEWLFGNSEFDNQILSFLSQPAVPIPSIAINPQIVKDWEDLLVISQIAPSKTQARQLITNGSILCWETKINNPKESVDWPSLVRGNFVLVTKGKKYKTLIKPISR
ncbi:MAG: tyrosine--tRNA ligase [Gammaproteobacteria bacterium]|nr:tyrosine--tRNA ligase [Gammaproteobacteria bacterium]